MKIFENLQKFESILAFFEVERSGQGGRISSKVSSMTLAAKIECKSKSTTGRRVRTFPAGDRHPQVNCHHSHGSRAHKEKRTIKTFGCTDHTLWTVSVYFCFRGKTPLSLSLSLYIYIYMYMFTYDFEYIYVYLFVYSSSFI